MRDANAANALHWRRSSASLSSGGCQGQGQATPQCCPSRSFFVFRTVCCLIVCLNLLCRRSSRCSIVVAVEQDRDNTDSGHPHLSLKADVETYPYLYEFSNCCCCEGYSGLGIFIQLCGSEILECIDIN